MINNEQKIKTMRIEVAKIHLYDLEKYSTFAHKIFQIKNMQLYNRYAVAGSFSLIVVVLSMTLACTAGKKDNGQLSVNQTESTQNYTWNTIDPAYKNMVEALVNRQRDKVGLRLVERQSVFGNKFGERDSIAYQIDSNKLEYASMMLDFPINIAWLEYHLDDEKLIFIRHRAWYKDILWGFAEETMIYLKDEKPYYVEDRKVRVDHRFSNAGLLRFMNYKPTKEPLHIIEKKITKYWPYIKQTVMDDIASKKKAK